MKIRLWTMGSLEHRIIPTKAAVEKLRNIIKENHGDGVLNLVWGDDLPKNGVMSDKQQIQNNLRP